MKNPRYTKTCIQCHAAYVGTKVASYCPTCAKEYSRTKYAICYRKHAPMVPHYREQGD